MTSIEKQAREGKTVWRAHYRTPDGRQRNKTFTREGDAAPLPIAVAVKHLSVQRLCRADLSSGD